MNKYIRFHASTLQVRSAPGGGRKIVGYAAVFNQMTTLREGTDLVQRETIAPGAFAYALSARQNVVALFNHKADHVLGRTSSGTLRLREDHHGLLVEIDPPDTELGHSVFTLIGRRDITGMSFAFIPRAGGEKREVKREGGRTVVHSLITAVDLYDVGPVTFPAYRGTSASAQGGIYTPDRAADDAARGRKARLSAMQAKLAEMQAKAGKPVAGATR